RHVPRPGRPRPTAGREGTAPPAPGDPRRSRPRRGRPAPPGPRAGSRGSPSSRCPRARLSAPPLVHPEPLPGCPANGGLDDPVEGRRVLGHVAVERDGHGRPDLEFVAPAADPADEDGHYRRASAKGDYGEGFGGRSGLPKEGCEHALRPRGVLI